MYPAHVHIYNILSHHFLCSALKCVNDIHKESFVGLNFVKVNNVPRTKFTVQQIEVSLINIPYIFIH